jgi:hypothetical protein
LIGARIALNPNQGKVVIPPGRGYAPPNDRLQRGSDPVIAGEVRLMKDIERALLVAVGARIAANGFESKLISQSFLRRFPAGRASLHLAFIKHPREFDVVADVAVRFDELEDLVNANNALLSKKEKGQTYSLGAELGNIAGGRPDALECDFVCRC